MPKPHWNLFPSLIAGISSPSLEFLSHFPSCSLTLNPFICYFHLFLTAMICKIEFIPSFYRPHSHIFSWDYCHGWADIPPGRVSEDPRESLLVHSLFFLSLLMNRSIITTQEWPKLFGFYNSALKNKLFFLANPQCCVSWGLGDLGKTRRFLRPSVLCFLFLSMYQTEQLSSKFPPAQIILSSLVISRRQKQSSAQKELWCFHKNREMKWWKVGFQNLSNILSKAELETRVSQISTFFSCKDTKLVQNQPKMGLKIKSQHCRNSVWRSNQVP